MSKILTRFSSLRESTSEASGICGNVDSYLGHRSFWQVGGFVPMNGRLGTTFGYPCSLIVIGAGGHSKVSQILNTSCSVDHDCIIGDFAHISPGAHLTGKVNIGGGAHIGAGVAVIPGCSVGSWAVVGVGAVVVEDIPPKVVAVGVPAKVG